jgi:hypothetical protein
MANEIIRDENPEGYGATIDKSVGGRFSAIGPTAERGWYMVMDHELGEELAEFRSREHAIKYMSMLSDEQARLPGSAGDQD